MYLLAQSDRAGRRNDTERDVVSMSAGGEDCAFDFERSESRQLDNYAVFAILKDLSRHAGTDVLDVNEVVHVEQEIKVLASQLACFDRALNVEF